MTMCTIHFFSIRSALVLVAICVFSPTSSTVAQQWLGLQNSMIEISYVPPTNPNYQATYERLKKRQALEELSAFLSPIRLPYKLPIRMLECGSTNAYYVHGRGLHLCYELLEFVSRIAPIDKTPEGFSRDDMIVGTFVQVALHEMGHAVFDVLQVPIFGREEDAADQISVFVMLQFGKSLARRVVTGSVRFWWATDAPMPRTAFADNHGTNLQRFYNLICIAYGGQPDIFNDLVEGGAFRDLVAAGVLPRGRALRCGREYEQVGFAFAKTIWPHIDEDLLKKVQSIEWAKWDSAN
jgi:hypothetical protein